MSVHKNITLKIFVTLPTREIFFNIYLCFLNLHRHFCTKYLFNLLEKQILEIFYFKLLITLIIPISEASYKEVLFPTFPSISDKNNTILFFRLPLTNSQMTLCKFKLYSKNCSFQ